MPDPTTTPPEKKADIIDTVEKILKDEEVQAKKEELLAEIREGLSTGVWQWPKIAAIVAGAVVLVIGSFLAGNYSTPAPVPAEVVKPDPNAKPDSKPTPKPEVEPVLTASQTKYEIKVNRSIWIDIKTNCDSVEWLAPEGDVDFRALRSDNTAHFSASTAGTYKVWILGAKNGKLLKTSVTIIVTQQAPKPGPEPEPKPPVLHPDRSEDPVKATIRNREPLIKEVDCEKTCAL